MSRTQTIACWVVVGLVALIITLQIAVNERDRRRNSPSSARTAAQHFVTQRLRAPTTAVFAETSRVDVLDVGRYRVAGTVDAANGFGAVVRARFICVVRATGQGRYECEALTFPRTGR